MEQEKQEKQDPLTDPNRAAVSADRLRLTWEEAMWKWLNSTRVGGALAETPESKVLHAQAQLAWANYVNVMRGVR